MRLECRHLSYWENESRSRPGQFLATTATQSLMSSLSSLRICPYLSSSTAARAGQSSVTVLKYAPACEINAARAGEQKTGSTYHSLPKTLHIETASVWKVVELCSSSTSPFIRGGGVRSTAGFCMDPLESEGDDRRALIRLTKTMTGQKQQGEGEGFA